MPLSKQDAAEVLAFIRCANCLERVTTTRSYYCDKCFGNPAIEKTMTYDKLVKIARGESET